jgi:Zn-dependent peptidase ImmA (M78 family)/DNA-binding XRE family transcriptional regulator
MARQLVPINGSVLRWAREEVGLTEAAFAEAVKAEPADVAAWESGEASPSKGAFTKIVEVLKRPSAMFFLPKPPVAAGLPTSLRNAPGLGLHKLDQAEVRQIRWARRLQDVVGWALRDAGEPALDFPRYSLDDDAVEVAATERARTDVAPAEQLEWDNASEAFRVWRGVLEARGVLVLQLSIGKGNVRGFSAWDDHAPLVAVNTSYHPTARIFTLFHELAHLLTRTDAACLRFILPTDRDSKLERWCERFAAAFLIPQDALRVVAGWYGASEAAKVTDSDVARKIANRFKVSTRATSIRLQELGLAPSSLYGSVESLFSALDWNTGGGGGGGGQPAPEKRLGQVGRRVTEVLLDAADAGRLNRRDLSDYLNLTTGQVADLASLVAER